MSAELQERQKQVIEAESKMNMLKQKLQQTTQRLQMFTMEAKRANMVEVELSNLKESHTTYKGIGRMFVIKERSELITEHQNRQKACETEFNKSKALEETLRGQLAEAEADFEKLYKKFQEEVKLLDAVKKN